MCRLYDDIQQAKKSDLDSIEAIIHRFDPKIKKSSRFIDDHERENLEQEIRIRIIKSVDKFETMGTPGFREFISHISE